ncbi:hypothetical protein F5Y17DRAFT_386841 [Xylariaceae sp. FL0594]|nr:hypothetical protein F5Y17DRAFT_386841 [Xylariaceae sp. FL0594]
MWSSQPVPKQESGKLRRKLQKINGPRPCSVDLSEMKPPPETKSHKRSSTFSIFSSMKSNPVHRPSLPPSLPPSAKPEDGKWLDDFRKSGYVYRESRRSRPSEACKENERPVSVIVPEFAHLTVKDVSHVETQPTSPPPRTNPPHSTLRRYAKTPVLRIGQLETHPLLDTQATSQEVPSIESIAESYRALLESRCSFTNEEHIASPEKLALPLADIPQNSSALPSPLEPVSEMPEMPLPRSTPRSEDGTLVNSDEELSYAGHYSATTSPASPSWSAYETASTGTSRGRGRQGPPHDTPNLKATIDLLKKELSSATDARPGQAKSDASALQVWVMIEAYEKLRARVLKSHGEDGPLATTFDTWLKALRSIHDELTGVDGARSESNYGD